MVNTREVTEEGLEKNFATNTMGTFLLTTALIPLLSNAQGSRVVSKPINLGFGVEQIKIDH